MSEYTYDSIIINPFKEGIESLIGKEVYFEAKPSLCLKAANEKLTLNLGKLVGVYKDSINPFFVKGKSGSYKYPCIIEKKEEPEPEFVPFKSADEFIDAYVCTNYSVKNGTVENKLLICGGIWLKGKVSGFYYMVAEICNNGVVLAGDQDTIFWGELLRDYVFPDDSPCGRLVEEKHE